METSSDAQGQRAIRASQMMKKTQGECNGKISDHWLSNLPKVKILANVLNIFFHSLPPWRKTYNIATPRISPIIPGETKVHVNDTYVYKRSLMQWETYSCRYVLFIRKIRKNPIFF